MEKIKNFEKKLIRNDGLMSYLYLCLLIYVFSDALIMAWFTLAPYLIWSQSTLVFGAGMSAYNWGYLVSNCHQLPQRSTFINDVQYPFCARDLGIYLGCLIGSALPFTKLKVPKHLSNPLAAPLLMAPMAVDGVTQSILNLRESNNELRLLTGFLFGTALTYYVAAWIWKNTRDGLRDPEKKRAKIVCLALAICFLTFSAYAGAKYVKSQDARGEIGFEPAYKTYIPKRVFRSIHWDPYLTRYDDQVLGKIYRSGRRDTGVWVFYEKYPEKAEHSVYPKTAGEIAFVPDLSST